MTKVEIATNKKTVLVPPTDSPGFEDLKNLISKLEDILKSINDSHSLNREKARLKLTHMAIKDFYSGFYQELSPSTLLVIAAALSWGTALLMRVLPRKLLPGAGAGCLVFLFLCWKKIQGDIKHYAQWKMDQTQDQEIRELYENAFSEGSPTSPQEEIS